MDVSEIDRMVENFFELKQAAEEAKDVAKEAERKVKQLQSEIIGALEGIEKTEWSGSFGKVSISQRRYYKMRDKDQVFEWLKANGDFEALATVNAQTFSSYIKQQVDDKRAVGDYAWMPDGVEDATSDYTYLRVKK